jgi:AcrR family transcriptional regulator
VEGQDDALRSPVELQPRRSPQQDRARETVAKILDATAGLLDEAGHTELTTNRVAERSGVNIATLYNYFPNKLALLHALAEKHGEQQQEQIDAIYAQLKDTGWRDIMDRLVDMSLEFNRTVTGAVALSLAMKSYPSLRRIDFEQDLRRSEFAAGILAGLGIKGSPPALQNKALMLFETATAMVDYALQFYPDHADAAMKEVKVMLKQYIQYWLDQSAEDSSPKNTAD